MWWDYPFIHPNNSDLYAYPRVVWYTLKGQTMLRFILAGLFLATPALAQEGDAAKGETEFRKCKACHMIQDPQGVDLVKGGKTGPNLYGILGRPLAAQEDYTYGEGLARLSQENPEAVWTQESLTAYISDPTAWVREQTGDAKAKSKMTFKMARNQADVVAFLAQHGAVEEDALDAAGLASSAPEAQADTEQTDAPADLPQANTADDITPTKPNTASTDGGGADHTNAVGLASTSETSTEEGSQASAPTSEGLASSQP